MVHKACRFSFIRNLSLLIASLETDRNKTTLKCYRAGIHEVPTTSLEKVCVVQGEMQIRRKEMDIHCIDQALRFCYLL